MHVRAIKQSGLAEDVSEKVKFKSQNSTVAKVSRGGLIMPNRSGVSIISIGYTDPLGGKLFTDSWVVEVIQLNEKRNYQLPLDQILAEPK